MFKTGYRYVRAAVALAIFMAGIPMVFGRVSRGAKAPDFAFPKTVSQQASKALATSLQTGDGQGVIRALMDYTLAESAIGGDNVPACLAKIDSVKNVVSEPAVKSVLDILEAVIYNNVYSQARWTYDRRNSPLLPLPADCKEWSGEQFRYRIGTLIDAALADSVALRKIPLAKYDKVITQDRMTAVYYPTLYDFVAHQALDIMEGWGNVVNHIFPEHMAAEVADSRIDMGVPSIKRDPVGEKILSIYASLIDGATRGSASDVNSRLGRLRFLRDHIVNVGNVSYDEQSRALFIKLYDSYCGGDGVPSSSYAGDILVDLPVDGKIERNIYDIIKAFLKAHPGYWRRDCLLQSIDRMSQKEVNISVSQIAAPGKSTRINVSVNNASNLMLDIYDVSSYPLSKEYYRFTPGALSSRKVASLPVEVGAATVPFTVNKTVEYTFAKPGNYIIVPVVDGVSPSRDSFRKVHVTRVALGACSFLDNTVWAVDANDGAPIEGAMLSIDRTPYNDNSRSERVGSTGADGSLAMDGKRGAVTATVGSDRYALPVQIYDNNYDRPDKWVMSVRGYSSLPLYHPGDTVEWSAVCYEFKAGLNRPYAGKSVEAVLYDANSMSVDTLSGNTDRFGRVSGKFLLPSTGLTGNFSIAVGGQRRAVTFEVSDYKLPTFRVVKPDVEQGVPTKGDVTVHGKVETYSGFPVADAEVTVALSVSQRPRWWYYSASYDVYSTVVRTDARGEYTAVIGDDVFATSPLPNGYYTAVITVLSATGETQTGETSFARGERYMIKTSLPQKFDMSEAKMPIEARVVNYEDLVVDMPVDVRIISADSSAVKSTVVHGAGYINVSGCPQGIYKVILACENADTVTGEVVLYDPASKSSPCPDRLIWAPEWKLTTEASGCGEWLYALNCDAHLLVTMWNDDGIISRRWVKGVKGFNRLNVELPAGCDEADLTLMVTGGYKQESADVEVKRADSAKGLKIVAETFRDRTVPGEEETWVFRVTDLSGNGREAAVIADMYNTALNVLATSDWSFNPSRGYMPSLSWNLPSSRENYLSYYWNVPSRRKGMQLRCPSIVNPDFETYGRSFRSYMIGGRPIMLRGMANGIMKKASKAEAAEVEEEMAVVTLDAGAADMAAPMMGAVREHAEKIDVEEAADEETPESKAGDGFMYRESNVPLAFFRPSLVTGEDGKLELRFTVPNANTTWGFRAVAFTDSLLTATFSRDVVASKDVMVQPNLPRFLRTGDKAVVKASVMNATGKDMPVDTEVTIYNPSTGETMLSNTMADTVPANGSVVVSIELNVPDNMPLIGYRIKATAGTHADGEQALIPVLPSSTPVIDTYPFYMASSQSEYSMKMPRMTKEGRVTLQFCENPAWYVVTALPGILDKEASTAPEAARSIFSAAVAAGLLNDNPAIADALKEWSESDRSSEMLTSMLERNSELKMMLLNATPWMLDARDDTERMTRLALLFDSRVVKNTIDANVKTLSKLSCNDGGWSWCAQYPRSSQWATRSTLHYLGRLAELGYLPADKKLRSMIQSALKWDSAETLKDFRKYPDGDYTEYVSLHDMFANVGMGKPDERIANAVTQRILKDWKDASLARKAEYARVLYAHSYKSVARNILASIRQYAESTPEKGMWFPSLDDNMWYGAMDKVGITSMILETFVKIEPGCPEIEPLRQWLILQKGATDWGSSSTAVEAVASVLMTSDRWMIPAQGSVIKLGRQEVKPEKYERLTGEVEMSFNADKVSGKQLSVVKKGDTPAWGAVYCRYTDDMQSVKAASCEELSIEKTLLVNDTPRDGDAYGRQGVIEAGDLRIGDRVTVRLTLKVNADMDYVVINDDRPACMEPVEQLPAPVYSEGLCFYRENRDSSTRIFIDHLPKGTYLLSYDVWVNNAGDYTSGIAAVQSQYAPRYSAHSAGGKIVSLSGSDD